MSKTPFNELHVRSSVLHVGRPPRSLGRVFFDVALGTILALATAAFFLLPWLSEGK